MLTWVISFAVLALLAGAFGFGVIASGFASIAKVLFFVFLALMIVSFVARALRGESVA